MAVAGLGTSELLLGLLGDLMLVRLAGFSWLTGDRRLGWAWLGWPVLEEARNLEPRRVAGSW